jgi:hypothetical protein
MRDTHGPWLIKLTRKGSFDNVKLFNIPPHVWHYGQTWMEGEELAGPCPPNFLNIYIYIYIYIYKRWKRKILKNKI